MNENIYKPFDDYCEWMGFDMLNSKFDEQREVNNYHKPRKHNNSNKTRIDGEYRAIMSEGMNYLTNDTNRDNIVILSYLFKLCPLIKYPENCVSINGENPSIEKLANLFQVSVRRVQQILKELEYMETIVKKKSGDGVAIYINPYLISSGPTILNSTLKYFENTTFASILTPEYKSKRTKKTK